MNLAYWLDWANLLLRWAHVVVAIAWIGSSFYFVFLDNSLTPPARRPGDDDTDRPDGELWAVHGGGFYHPQKYLVAPRTLPDKLHWFYWESYSTWLTGFALLTVLYLFNAQHFLIDARVHAWSPAAAVATALALLAGFWLAYDALCRGFGQRQGGERLVGIGVTLLVLLAAWLATQWFAARAAFVLVGAMMATAMSANVFFWIIPGQRRVIAQMKAGEPVDARHGQRAKQRSVHNTYFTLPVLVAMLSNHYGWLTEGPQAWLVLSGLMAAGALIRHSFVARHRARVQGRPAPWGAAIAGALLLGALALWRAPATAPAPAAAAAPVRFEQVQAIVERRCLMCHNAQQGAKGVALHTPALIRQHAPAILQQTVLQKTMPLNNATQMTEDERALLGRWITAGAGAGAP